MAKEPKANGRPPFEPTDHMRSQVEAWAAVGVPHEDIAKMLTGPNGRAIDAKTLRKHFRHELDNGAPKANANVVTSLYKRATGNGRDAVTAAKFWLSCCAGWKDRPRQPTSTVRSPTR